MNKLKEEIARHIEAYYEEEANGTNSYCLPERAFLNI